MAKTRAQREPELLRAARSGNAKVAALFGGQGFHNSKCLEELKHLQETQSEATSNLLQRAGYLLEQLARQSHASGFHHDYGFNLSRWLTTPSTAPPKSHLSSAPVSFPLNTLLSLAHYCIACRKVASSPGQFNSALTCAVGYSQGVFAALAIAQSDSWNDFWEAAELAIRLSFAVGLESHRLGPPSHLSAAVRQQCLDAGYGDPSPMLSIRGLTRHTLADTLKYVNNHSRKQNEGYIHLALAVSRDRHVVAGPVSVLWDLCTHLGRIRALATQDQSRIPFPNRKPVVDIAFLPISAPFHSSYLNNVEDAIMNSSVYLPASISTPASVTLTVPYLDTHSGDLIRSGSKSQLARAVVRAVTAEPVEWHRISLDLAERLTHLIDFGPGHMGDLTLQNTLGSGLTVIDMAHRSSVDKSGIWSSADFHSVEAKIPVTKRMSRFGPRLVRDQHQDSYHIDNKMSRLFGTPPIMVAAMVPTTMHPDVVAPILRAGYHAELAGGGYSNEARFEEAVRRLATAVPPHRGITCNLIYASPQTIAWQISCLRRLIREGVSISGVTIGAGIPSDDVVKEYIETLGLKHISFKPGSSAALERVVEIAKKYPRFPIGLQWTGGRAGGHHSSEDFHEPILEHYGQIRACDNIVLIVGSGFGGGEDSVQYLTGEWSRAYGYPPFPFDGISFGSRFMVCKEAHTSQAAKQLIVETEGVSDADWHKTYDGPAGGVVTIQSEMGQPIHVLATRGVMLWRELDAKVFSMKNPTDRLAWLHAHSAEIMERLNNDYAKPWFPVTANNELVQLAGMTYSDVLQRLLELLHVDRQNRWIDPSYERLVQDFLHLSTARFGCPQVLIASKAEDVATTIKQDFVAKIGNAGDDLLYPEDVLALTSLFRRRGQKPVPFIPALDENFETWFKKDCLWQAEDLDAVVGKDVQRVTVIHGPVAVRYSTTSSESAVDILDGIKTHYIRRIRETSNAANETESKASATGPDIGILTGLAISTPTGSKTTRYELVDAEDVPNREELLHFIADRSPWLHAALVEEKMFGDFGWLPNPVHNAFKPCAGDVLEVDESHDIPGEIASVRLLPKQDYHFDGMNASQIAISLKDDSTVSVVLFPGTSSTLALPLSLTYSLSRDAAGSRLYVSRDMALQNSLVVRAMYHSLWSQYNSPPPTSAGFNWEYRGEAFTLTATQAQQFDDVVGRVAPDQLPAWGPGGALPLDFCVVLAWEALTRPLMIPSLECDFMRLLHQSVTIEQIHAQRPLEAGDVVRTMSRITGLSTLPKGRRIEVTAEILRDDSVVVKITTDFFVRNGTLANDSPEFKSIAEPEMLLSVDTDVTEALIKSRRWLRFDKRQPSSPLLGLKLIFRMVSHTTFGTAGNVTSVHVSGDVYSLNQATSAEKHVGNVYFDDEEQGACNLVMDFLDRHGAVRELRQPLEKPGWTDKHSAVVLVNAPVQSRSYAVASTDHNPIHVCPVFARFAGLDSVVVHGMNTSAIALRLLHNALGDVSRTRVRKWKVTFQDIVLPGDPLRVEFQHIAMQRGAMVVQVQVANDRTGDRVMEVEAIVDQESTAYVFAGQGSQAKGMGMDLYEKSPYAKDTWDRGDAILREKFGFSILELVRNNPVELRVTFGGKRGRKVRANYLAMTRRLGSVNEGGQALCIVDGLHPKSEYHTFTEQRGLLFSTQFSQPALALMEIAEYEHLRASGLTQASSQFAGHSLGEYAALGACTSFMSLENLLNLVFYRGLKMQNALARDENGRTDFAMLAVDPARVGKRFDEAALQTVVRCIHRETDLLLEVVNYNVESQQYVCAGHFRSLWTLTQVLNGLAEMPDQKMSTIAHEEAKLRLTVQLYATAARSLKNEHILERGKATIPLLGIDIPFHSTMLRGEIEHYREYLRHVIKVGDVKPAELVNRWIPNVTGKPLSLDKSYLEEVYRATGSEPLRKLIEARS